MVSCKMKCDKSFKLYRISFFMCYELIICNTFFILGGVNLRMITFRHLSYEDREKIEKLMNANITSGIADEQLERIALIDKEYKSVFNMADRRKEGNTKVDLPFPDVKEVSEEIKGYNIDRNIEESDCKKITDKERSEKIMHQRMMLGRAR